MNCRSGGEINSITVANPNITSRGLLLTFDHRRKAALNRRFTQGRTIRVKALG
jgi:hypothetical protein